MKQNLIHNSEKIHRNLFNTKGYYRFGKQKILKIKYNSNEKFKEWFNFINLLLFSCTETIRDNC